MKIGNNIISKSYTSAIYKSEMYHITTQDEHKKLSN